MKRIKKSKIKHQSVVYNNIYISYDNNGEVTGVNLETIPNVQQIEVPIHLLPNFMSGNKMFKHYPVEYFIKIKNEITKDTLEDSIDLEKTNFIFYEILESTLEEVDILFEHNSLKKSWIIHIDKNSDTNALNQFSFFVTKKNNPNFLYSSYNINLKENNFPIEIKFKTNLEIDFNSLSVYTKKYFKSYQLRKIDG